MDASEAGKLLGNIAFGVAVIVVLVAVIIHFSKKKII